MQAIWNSLAIVTVLTGVTAVVVSDHSTMLPSEQPGTVEQTPRAVDFQPPEVAEGPAEQRPTFGRAVPWSSFDEMHDVYTQAFVDSEGFGMRRIMTFSEPQHRSLFVDGVPHRVIGMQLVGLMQDEPVAYKSNWINVTRNALAHSEQRPLTESEWSAVTSLDAGEAYVWQPAESTSAANVDATERLHRQPTGPFMSDSQNDQQNHGRLVGALRATGSCVQCHDVAEGTLLGAFVYKLQPVPQLPSDLHKDQSVSQVLPVVEN